MPQIRKYKSNTNLKQLNNKLDVARHLKIDIIVYFVFNRSNHCELSTKWIKGAKHCDPRSNHSFKVWNKV